MIETRSLSYAYDKETSIAFPDMTLSDASVILGPSGAGKTTLLHLLAGLRTPAQGEVSINGQVLSSMSKSVLDRFRGAHIGVVFQQHHSIRSLSLRENLEIIQKVGSGRIQKTLIDELVAQLQLEQVVSKRPHQLSQGQKQRLSIAMALVNQPKILLADEPTSSLDDTNCHRVIELFQQQAEATQTQLVVITHDQRIASHFNQTINL